MPHQRQSSAISGRSVLKNQTELRRHRPTELLQFIKPELGLFRPAFGFAVLSQ